MRDYPQWRLPCFLTAACGRGSPIYDDDGLLAGRSEASYERGTLDLSEWIRWIPEAHMEWAIEAAVTAWSVVGDDAVSDAAIEAWAGIVSRALSN